MKCITLYVFTSYPFIINRIITTWFQILTRSYQVDCISLTWTSCARCVWACRTWYARLLIMLRSAGSARTGEVTGVCTWRTGWTQLLLMTWSTGNARTGCTQLLLMMWSTGSARTGCTQLLLMMWSTGSARTGCTQLLLMMWSTGNSGPFWRVLFLATFQHVGFSLSSVQCPGTRRALDSQAGHCSVVTPS